MFEYLLTFLVLLMAAMVFYLVYDRFSKPHKEDHNAQYVDALKDLLDQRTEAAFTKLRQVVADDSTNLDAYLRLGQILRDYKKPQQALQVHKDLTLRGGLTLDEKTSILKQLYADYMALDDLDMAEAALKEITQIKSKDHWAQTRLLDLQRKRQKWDEAYNTAVMLLKIEENKSKKPLAVFKYQMGLDLYHKREYHKARILMKEAIGFDPKFVDAYLSIGDSYCKENRFEDAVNFWNKMISTIPEKGHLALDRLKKTLFDIGRFGEMDSICEKILTHSPKNAEARHCLAEFYDKKGDIDQAETLLNGLLEDHPDDTKALLELIRIYLEKNDTTKILQITKLLEQKLTQKSGSNVTPDPGSVSPVR